MTMNLGVTLHSFGHEYYTYRYAMEDCIAAVASLAPGAGVELVAPQMIRGFPDLPDEFEHRFRRAVDAHGVRPTAYGGYGDAQRGEGRWAPRDEQVDYLQRQIRAARRLGFPLIRVQPSEVVLTDLVGFAEENDVRMVIEIHSPMSIETIEPLIERVEAVDSPFLGFAPDLGMFSHRVADVAANGYRSRGVPDEIIDLILRRWQESAPERTVVDEVISMGGDELAQQFASESALFWGHSEPSALRRIMPLVRHVHGKFYNADADGVDSAVRFAEVIDELLGGGFDGSISFEYDGFLWNPADAAIDQIRRIHATTLRQIHSKEG